MSKALRAATLEDAPDLARLQAESFADAWSASDIAGLLSDPGAIGLVVLRQERLAGFLIARAVGGEAEILTVAVEPARRRGGLGSALVETAAALAHAAGAQALFLEVATDNAAAIGLYQAAGFRRAGLRPAYYRRPGAPPADAFVLRRDLTG